VTKVPILSDEWNALWVAEAATLQPGPGPSGSLEVSLRRDDDHVRTFTCYFVDGRMREVVSRPDDAADLKAEIPESVWQSICEGHPEVLEKVMLNGQMRLTGDRARMMELVPAVWSDEAQALRARVHEQTIY